MKLHRDAARMIVLKDGQLLVMERWRRDKKTGEMLHYFSIPGGGIEDGEAPAEAALREVQEEMTVEVDLGPEVAIVEDGGGTRHYYFLGLYMSGTPMLHPDSPEAQHMTDDDKFVPRWLPLTELESANFYPIYLQLLPLIHEINDGKIPSHPWHISLDDL